VFKLAESVARPQRHHLFSHDLTGDLIAKDTAPIFLIAVQNGPIKDEQVGATHLRENETGRTPHQCGNFAFLIPYHEVG
jgi:hypothetical protein